MIFLINASNLKAGGGLQVADSICGQLKKYRQHQFVVVLSSYLAETSKRIRGAENIIEEKYTIPSNFRTIVFGRDVFLDYLVEKHHVQAVLTVFGPSRWAPKVPHLSGFAMPHLVIPESPFFKRMRLMERLKWKCWCNIRKWSFKKSANWFWTENSYISNRLENLFNTSNVYTISNYYNQVFDSPDKWKRNIVLPEFEGTTCLSISSPTAHKNFGIIEGIVRYLIEAHTEFKVRFVLTCDETQLPLSEDIRNYVVYVGKTDVAEGPNLYAQSDIMFMPTLLECFTATYPEAMKMNVPIVTSDMEFARGLCGDAACYYCSIDAKAAAEAIYKVATDKEYAAKLVANGKEQLKSFDNYEQRADKLIKIMEDIANEKSSNT